MNETPDEESLLGMIAQAMSAALGRPITGITLDTFLKADLGLESIDLVDIGYEIEQAVGSEVDFRELLLSGRSYSHAGPDDLQIRKIARFLAEAGKKS